MIIVLLYLLLGLCALDIAADTTEDARHGFLETSSSLTYVAPLSPSDLVIVYTTTTNRLPLVHATRPARHGIRTYIVLQDANEAARLNKLYGGAQSEFNETYLAWPDGASYIRASGKGGPYGRRPLTVTHPLHLIGPTWAMAPMLVHAALMASIPTLPKVSSAGPGAGLVAVGVVVPPPPPPSPPPPPPPYRWMLVARDDTLWRPHHAVRLLSQYDSSVAVTVSDHFVDFNGQELLAPSAAAAVCLPCGFNLTAMLGRRHPPGVPKPGCPVCRPAGGCEFRFDLCNGLVGGPHCGSKRFLGSGDRCAHSWVAGGAGVALSVTLLSYIDSDEWAGCVRGQQPSTGERTLARCLWRVGFSFTHPATGLAEGLTRDVFSDRHMLFGNPMLRQEVFGADTDALLARWYKVEQEGKMAATLTASVGSGGSSNSTAVTPASTRLRSDGASECDQECRRWLAGRGVSVHLDVPYADGVDVAAAAAMLQKAAQGVDAGAQGI